MKKVISLVFALSVIGSPSLSWGWGEGGWSYSKDKTNQETKTEQIKKLTLKLEDQANQEEFLTEYFAGIKKGDFYEEPVQGEYPDW